ncbi:MAG: GTP-binding protein [Chloroflexi bacterium]|jgi:G3E family GTPase|nr:GTP-binding protein [Chloroflexota bacterium]MBT3670270.1 GTP-binding protein [Chloroflexota bacterium]MBT4003253.1 GTP-binding protein [Chloroflexota bacterium]MBT4306662.1 GTP-binding protein [Chloroflexota bacterium]MBT4683635.1 GTP-binding protein [Chloroflexota bacterium]
MSKFFKELDLHTIPVPPEPVPVIILTGFLGSGKTTLLNNLLNGNHGLRIAVLVNDFGSINIDSQLVTDVEGQDLISLENGCICCTIRNDLLDTVLGLLARDPIPEMIVIEASGISYPAEIAKTFLLKPLQPYIRVDTILGMIDTDQVLGLTGQAGALARDQVSMSDMVVLNKIDLVDADKIELVRDWVQRIVPMARILECAFGNIPLEILLNTGSFALDQLESRVQVHHPAEHSTGQAGHASEFYTWNYVSEEALSFDALKDVIYTLPSIILRAKGFIYLGEVPERRGILQLSGSRVTLSLGEPRGERKKETQLVFISNEQEIDTMDLQLRFDSCRLSEMGEDYCGKTLNEIEEWIRNQ